MGIMKEIGLDSWQDFKIGHAQNKKAGTGCSVILPAEEAVAGVDVRGGAPGTRETDLLTPGNLADRVNAILLTGGSAYGLEAAAGVMQYLEEQGRGFEAGGYKVPLVPAAVLFDLTCGDGSIRPDKEMGYQACQAAGFSALEGNFGAGTGATVGKYAGLTAAMKGGIGQFIVQVNELKIGAIFAVNALGDVFREEGNEPLAGAREQVKTNNNSGKGNYSLMAEQDNESYLEALSQAQQQQQTLQGNTVIGTIFTNADLTNSAACRLAKVCHDGIARAIKPSHTMLDGDTVFVLASGQVDSDLNMLTRLGVKVTARAIVRGVEKAETAYGYPGLKN